jgi:hypothetical protein
MSPAFDARSLTCAPEWSRYHKRAACGFLHPCTAAPMLGDRILTSPNLHLLHLCIYSTNPTVSDVMLCYGELARFEELRQRRLATLQSTAQMYSNMEHDRTRRLCSTNLSTDSSLSYCVMMTETYQDAFWTSMSMIWPICQCTGTTHKFPCISPATLRSSSYRTWPTFLCQRPDMAMSFFSVAICPALGSLR